MFPGPSPLRAVAESTRELEFLGIDWWRREGPRADPFVELIKTAAGFRTLKAFFCGDRHTLGRYLHLPTRLDNVEAATARWNGGPPIRLSK